MKTRFLYESITGVLCIILTLLFGKIGLAAFLLFVPVFFIRRFRKQNLDERELQLFNRAGNISLAGIFISFVVVYILSDIIIFGHLLGDYMIQLNVGMLYFIHGMTGLVIFIKN